jgi:hypothetical protein
LDSTAPEKTSRNRVQKASIKTNRNRTVVNRVKAGSLVCLILLQEPLFERIALAGIIALKTVMVERLHAR